MRSGGKGKPEGGASLLIVVMFSHTGMELAALGPAIMLTDSSAYLFFWLNVACTNLVASALAKDDAEEAFKSVSDTLWCGATIGVGICVDTCVHVPGPPYCAYGLRVPASCALHVPKAQGGLPRGTHRRTRISLGRAVPYAPRAAAGTPGRHERGAVLLRARRAGGPDAQGARDAGPCHNLPKDPPADAARAHPHHGAAGRVTL